MGSKHDEAMRKAASIRAAIMAQLNARVGTPLDLNDLWANLRDKFIEEGYKDDKASLRSVLQQMRDNQQVSADKIGAFIKYWVGDLENPRTPRSTTPKKTLKPSDLKVDVLKSSGRVRLTINGLVIDIGVE